MTKLTALETLRIASNSLTGTIPNELSQMSALESLSFSLTLNETEFPTVLFSLPALNMLTLLDSTLSSIPTEVGAMPQLEEFVVIASPTEGTIPSELGLLTNLSILRMTTTFMSGALPTAIGQLSRMTHLGLNTPTLDYLEPLISYHGIIGNLPSEMSLLTDLEHLISKGNKFSGPIPDLSNATGLRSLNLDG
ncbi:Leucine rich repeat N-terminal domain [Seminavis robusta]|uniref:Leucine rich repeat N-terminal domain n=1 Tax=Seminavis robusta TaxID=568900 RepID=A0A9N8HGM2_9STRA|nr:Leucine rich repeat N-terminal domain [Seminavis robusta]|eukprot:Sro645_g180570.1 Leucine rich repeat N-terminal domain (193) ;mRNA; f:2450-3028